MNTYAPSPTYFLFARPSFWAGTAALFDFSNALFDYNMSLTTEQANYFAMKADWRAVGDALRDAIRKAGADKEGVSIGAQEEA